jgi:Spy/CpxP family protein refolding chaperone
MSAIFSSRRGISRTVLGSLLVAAAVLTTQPSLAHGHRGGNEGHGQHGMMFGGGQRHIERMLDMVEATDAQRTAIKSIAAAAQAKAAPIREQHRALREQGRALLGSQGAVERGAAENLRLRMMALHDQGSKIRMDAMLDIADQLTPAQRAKIGAMMAQRGERMREHRMRHGGDAAPKS